MIIVSTSIKNAIEILIEIVLHLWIALGGIDVLIILILVVHEHKVLLHLCVSSVSFSIVL